MMGWPSALFMLVSMLVGEYGAEAIRVPIQGQRRSGKWWQSLGGVVNERRTMVGIVDLQNAGDLQYYMNVTLGERQFRVLVDSGSADLWVAGDVIESSSTGHNATIHYSDGVVEGDVRTAALQIQGYTIPDQAYISEDVDSVHRDGQGILGLGPSRLSSVLASLGSSAGDPPLDRLFRQTTSLPTYISILLGRSNDPDSDIPGQLTIGEVLEEYEDVKTSPQLPIERIDWDQHWMVSLDKSGIIGPDGKPIAASVTKQLNVIFDSGYTLPQVPKSVADAIYSRVPGARYVNISATATPVWTLPCTTELNITFKFGGISYPVHPLDTVMDDLHGPLDDTGKPSCVGAFQPMTADEPYDIVLGMAFLRNAYILMSFGNFVDGTATQADQPYVQLRSITDPAEAHQDFVQQRLNGIDTTGSQKLLPPSDADNTQVTITVQQKLKPYIPWIISASILGGLLLVFLVAYFFIWRSGRRYRRLHEPAPCGVGVDEKPSLRHLQSETPSEATFLIPEKGLPNPYERDTEAHAEALSRKVGAGDLTPNRRPYQTRSIFSARESSSASDTVRLLPNPPKSAVSYVSSVGGAQRKPLPCVYVGVSETSSPQSLSPEVHDRPLPDPYASGQTPRVAEMFDISRSRNSSIYTLPPLQFSAVSLSVGPPVSSAASQHRKSLQQ
ncbi:hypothetical protein BN946_scf184775.g9 [Trametes cinnabarina]|uniref:Peptidase A1 domain-containing protein n=1 Tax=Pycnoporus cinnabarinus TaxID=5643 RepID=A0A060SYM4_PYCCI|nr:hypothetical protein BN946_scf184775.g9 [Trametes cinnabarina]